MRLLYYFRFESLSHASLLSLGLLVASQQNASLKPILYSHYWMHKYVFCNP